MNSSIQLTGISYGPVPTGGKGLRKPSENGDFAAQLSQQISIDELKMSRHAAERLASRNIELTAEEKTTISKAIDAMEEKGTRNGLVIMGDKAVVVSVRNKTVITVMNAPQTRGNVFTNIDGAVIAA